jgi:hypothetical protein
LDGTFAKATCSHTSNTFTEDGFAYNGMTYGSLTKIARIITGAHWSGPRFFGLNGKTGNGENTGGNGESDG